MTNPTLETIVAKLQVRRGALDDLPILDPGELGYATDVRRLFIGNDPVTFVGNGTDDTFTIRDSSIIPNQLSVVVNGVTVIPKIQGSKHYYTDAEEPGIQYPTVGTTIVFDTAPKTPDVITIKINGVVYSTTITSNLELLTSGSNRFYRLSIPKPNWFNTPVPPVPDNIQLFLNDDPMPNANYLIEELVDTNNVKTYVVTVNKNYIYNGLITVSFNTEIKTQNSEKIVQHQCETLKSMVIDEKIRGLNFYVDGPIKTNTATIEYSLNNGNGSLSVGNMSIVTDGFKVAIVNDTGTSTEDSGISFNTLIEGQRLYLTYTNTSDYPANFYYSIRLWNTI